MSPRREFGAAIALAVVAGALALSAAGQTWVRLTAVRRPPLPPVTDLLSGGQVAPLVTATGLLALCEHAAAMVSIDTGPAQAAAALGCPLIVLYGAQPPSLWKPRSPTASAVITLGGLPQRNRVDQIPLEEVTAALDRLVFRTGAHVTV